MDLRITGLREVQQKLKDASRLIVAASYAKALDRAGGVFAAAIQERAEGLDESGSDTPLSEHVVVTVEVDTQKRGGIATVGFDSTQDARTGIPQDLKAFLVEFGHRLVSHKPDKKEVGHVPAHPFVGPAFDQSADKAVEVFAETLKETLASLSSLGPSK